MRRENTSRAVVEDEYARRTLIAHPFRQLRRYVTLTAKALKRSHRLLHKHWEPIRICLESNATTNRAL